MDELLQKQYMEFEKKKFAIDSALKMNADISSAEVLIAQAQTIYDFIK